MNKAWVKKKKSNCSYKDGSQENCLKKIVVRKGI